MVNSFKPCLVVLHGPPLHGKSTIAAHLVSESNLAHVDVDEIRREYFPQTSGQLLSKEQELALMVRCYELSVERAAAICRSGKPVVFSATCSRSVFKQPVVRFIRENTDISVCLFRLDIDSPTVIRDRIAARARGDSPSPIRTEEQYRWALSIIEPWPSDVAVISVDAARDPFAVAGEVQEHLASHKIISD